MICPNCGTYSSLDDRFCSRCGAALDAPTLPVLRTMPTLPARWEQARPALVRGLAALAVGTAAEMVRREGLRRLASFLIRRAAKSAPAETKPAKVEVQHQPAHEEELERGEGVVSEFIYFRRTRVRY